MPKSWGASAATAWIPDRPTRSCRAPPPQRAGSPSLRPARRSRRPAGSHARPRPCQRFPGFGARPNHAASSARRARACFALCRTDTFWAQALASPVRSVWSGAAARAINPLSSRDSMRRPTSLAILRLWRIGKCGLKQADHLLAASGLIEDSPRGRGHWVEVMDSSRRWCGEKELIADFAGFYPRHAPEASAWGASVRLRCGRLLDCVPLFRRHRSIASAARFLRRECFPQQKGCARHFVVAQAVACRRFGELHQTV